MIYDARGNGDGQTAPTMTGDHNAHISDYTAIVCGESTEMSDTNGKLIVRRLMPLECERLQGYPDGWTEFGADDKPISDSQRYRGLGNSLALPCADYVMRGIAEALARNNLQGL